PAAAQRGAGGGSGRPQVGRGRDRGARAQRAGHDPPGRSVLPRGRRPARPSAAGAGPGGAAVSPDPARGVWAIVVAAGRGSRFGGELPKQYVEVAGRPLLGHALDAVLSHPGVRGAVVVLAEGDRHWPGWDRLHDKPLLACTGGDSRAGSVPAGPPALPHAVRADGFVPVHDAAGAGRARGWCWPRAIATGRAGTACTTSRCWPARAATPAPARCWRGCSRCRTRCARTNSCWCTTRRGRTCATPT